MNIALSRLVEGIIATMRSDVIPHISDPFARGQAIGVIDLLNNIAPRVEWSQAPLLAAVESKTALLREIDGLIPELKADGFDGEHRAGPEELATRLAELDSALAEALAVAWRRRNEESCARAIAAIKAHFHDEAAEALKKTRKPLFAEIASGKDAKAGE